jgi:phage terminase large subunit-like protein
VVDFAESEKAKLARAKKEGWGKQFQRAIQEGWSHHVRTKSDEQALREGCYFDSAAAARVVAFFPTFLTHCKGKFAGKPFELLEWQIRDVIEPIYGWKRANGYRRFTRVYIEIPKKNGKSTLAAGIGLYMLAADKEFGANCYSVASDRLQANIVHGEAVNMVEASPKLRKALKINRSSWLISYRKKLSTYRSLSSSPSGKEGFDGHCAICDELHVWQGRELWDALRYMGRARTQPLIFVITTAGDSKEGVCWEQHEYALKVLSGEIVDTRFYPLVFALTEKEIEGDKIYDRKLWRKANPSLGFTIDEEEFARDLAEAMASPRTRAAFLRYSFNIWAQSETRWLPMDIWAKAAKSIEFPKLETAYAGLDLAKVSDMSALVLTFGLARDPVPSGMERLRMLRDLVARGDQLKEGEIYCLPRGDARILLAAGVAEPYESPRPYHQVAYFWIPEDRVKELEKENANNEMRRWAEGGYVRLTRGNVTEYSVILAQIKELNRRYRIDKLAFDPWQAESLTQDLEADGIERIEFGQTMGHYAHPTAEFERLLRLGLLTHAPNPVLDWQARNVTVKTDVSGNYRPVKPAHDDHRKIDGIVAAIMSLDTAMLSPESSSTSSLVY